MQISGPVAQASLAVFDDQWEGSDMLDCRNLDPPLGIWFFSCQNRVAVADHPPEVLRYYLPDSNSVAFSLYRNTNYHESDEAVTTALSSATQSLDVFEVNFSLEVQCMLMLVSQDLCSFENALPYMDAMLAAIEQNHVKTRVLVTNVNSNGLENFIAIHVFREELERRGLEEYVEFRFYEGRMHTKAALIDDAFLIIGSQNFHYSAFGDGGLAEYNLATEDPQAIQAFQDAFEYYWDLGIPLDQAKPAFE
jgi:phosphatidylserine/phosphatidylglycerophosphate/cardiolipin synthase-like enzyme